MTITSSLTSIVHLTQLITSLWAGTLSYNAIIRVQTYEAPTEKAAKWSNVADDHLQTTRVTQGLGAVSSLLSTLAAGYLTFSSRSKWTAVCLSAVTAVVLGGSSWRIAGYWRGKWKVPLPGSGDYNDAITWTDRLRRTLDVLAVSWGVVAVGYLVAGVVGGGEG